MPVSPNELIARYPTLWHMAEDGAWPSIEKYGLRSTSRLLDLYGITGVDRHQIERAHRAESIELRAPGLPPAVVRDQAPINEGVLKRVLQDGLTPSDWYGILNERVFFWVSEKRLATLLEARRYRRRPHTIIIAATSEVLQRCGPDITLCPMNSGNTMMTAMPRGIDTFAPLDKYPFHERRKAGLEPVVELAVEGMINDIAAVALRVERRLAGETPVLLWTRP